MMNNPTMRNGWERLPNGYDVEFRDNIPVRLSDNGKGQSVPEETLIEEVSALSALHVQLGIWQPGEKNGEREAPVFISNKQLREVLRLLALSSAAMFYDRFHKSVDQDDPDWDRLEYLKDLATALEHCKLDMSDINQDAYIDEYVKTMHEETRRLSTLAETPLVEPE
jgi:hypothetical protein